ncbi:hypothetical protein C7M61_005158 [Candidozyma pseudohaemuli]|uniref:Uncharacterized protein n=1 Tax=Candidozyma pseudohaemuli TaxID=418784 RepID=A0A2P7YCZ0_9ASCO|nr:hypothetical protein C7M61_005158 [[Candida] pseudohaemulonii]PSK33814.1 hypothetical protein C7M61_005158 [[Candida] pseudohaemulonii]
MNFLATPHAQVCRIYKEERYGDQSYCELLIPFVLRHPKDLIWWSIWTFESIRQSCGYRCCDYIRKYVKDVDEGAAYLESLPEQDRIPIKRNADKVCAELLNNGIRASFLPPNLDDTLCLFKRMYDEVSKVPAMLYTDLLIHWKKKDEQLDHAHAHPAIVLAFCHTHLVEPMFKVLMVLRPRLKGDFVSFIDAEFQRRGIERMDIKSLYFDNYQEMFIYPCDLEQAGPFRVFSWEEPSALSKRHFIKCTHCHKKVQIVDGFGAKRTGYFHGREKQKAQKKESGRKRAYHRNRLVVD